jgi:hypothetical protein
MQWTGWRWGRRGWSHRADGDGGDQSFLGMKPFGILPREKCYNGVFVRLRTRSHPSVYPGDSYTLTLSRRHSGEVKKYQQILGSRAYKLQRISLRTPDPPGYNSHFTTNGCLHLYPNVGGFRKGPTAVTTASYPQDKSWDTTNRRITRTLDTTSTLPTTTIARLCLTSRSNTIALHINTE